MCFEKPPSKRTRSRNILFYTPPFSKAVKTNITAAFNQLVAKHFPKGSPLAKIFNRNYLKISYSTTANMAALISAHNKKLLAEDGLNDKNRKLCNCKGGVNQCPVRGECLKKNVVYCATVEVPGNLHPPMT